jgi:hypothetical protein
MPGRYALIVANGTYRDPKLSRLRTPTRDAEELARVLHDPEIGAFAVELAIDEPESVLRRKIATFFSDRGRDDLLLLHFSCHGLKDDSGQLYFAAPDTEVAHLDATALSAEFVSRQMTRSRSRKVVALLDCCYSGAIARGLRFRGGDQVDLDDHLGGHGRVILTASSAMEYAFEGEELTGTGNPSVFTTAVVKGLETGEADRDQDRRISVEELYDYVCEQVREITPDQSPNMLSHLEGELFVARSSYVAPVPATELPVELREAIDSSLAGVREGAVTELGRLLGAHDPGLAHSAREALQRLTEDDSRRVGAAATAALAAHGPEPAAPATQPVAAPPAPARAAAEPVRAPPAPATEPAAAPPAPARAAAEPVRAAPAEAPAARPARAAPAGLTRWAPLGLSVAGALLVLASLTVFASQPWEPSLNVAGIVTALAVVAAALASASRIAGIGGPALHAVEPVLAGFPIGLAAAAGGLKEKDGLYFPAWVVAIGGLLLLAGVLWRRGRVQRPRKGLVALVVVAGIGLFLSPGFAWFYDSPAVDELLWPITLALAIAALVAVGSVAVGLWRGGRAWAVLLGGAGGIALLGATAVLDYTTGEGAEANGGLVLAFIAGLLLSAAGVVAMLRDD